MNDDVLDRFLQEIGKNSGPIEPGDPTLDRLPAVFAIDRSDSTRQTGDIVEINAFLRRFAEAVASPPDEAWERIQAHLNLHIVAYGDHADEILPWIPGDKLQPSMIPELTGAGMTSMAAGLEHSSRAMLHCLADFRKQQIPCFRGYIFNVTDGNATDMWPENVPDETVISASTPEQRKAKAARWKHVKSVLDGLETKSTTGLPYASTFHCASRKANRDVLRLLAHSTDRVVDLDIANFDKLFKFIRISLTMAVEDKVG
jgi:uncharacterized protein YegL